jgi:hypothetical protein
MQKKLLQTLLIGAILYPSLVLAVDASSSASRLKGEAKAQCSPVNSPCASSLDCCIGTCNSNVCTCLAVEQTCTKNSDCCSNSCTNTPQFGWTCAY